MESPLKRLPSYLTYKLRVSDAGTVSAILKELDSDPHRPDLREAEADLLSRQDPQIDAALAAYGRAHDVLATLYNRTDELLVQAAILNNPSADADGWAGTVLSWAQALALLTQADSLLLSALASNPSFAPEGLLDILSQNGPAEHFPEHGFAAIFDGLANHPYVDNLFDQNRRHRSASSRAHCPDALLAVIGQMEPSAKNARSLAKFLSHWNASRLPSAVLDAPNIEAVIAHWHVGPEADIPTDPRFHVVMNLRLLCGTLTSSDLEHPYLSVQAAYFAGTSFHDTDDVAGLVAAHPGPYVVGIIHNPQLLDGTQLADELLSQLLYIDQSAITVYQELLDQRTSRLNLDRPVTMEDFNRANAQLFKRLSEMDRYSSHAPSPAQRNISPSSALADKRSESSREPLSSSDHPVISDRSNATGVSSPHVTKYVLYVLCLVTGIAIGIAAAHLI